MHSYRVLEGPDSVPTCGRSLVAYVEDIGELNVCAHVQFTHFQRECHASLGRVYVSVDLLR